MTQVADWRENDVNIWRKMDDDVDTPIIDQKWTSF